MKIGLYFGSFNPIHTGHLIIANHVANTGLVQKIWFVVSPQNPLKTSATLLNEYNRLHLVQVAIEEDVRMKASDIEFKLPKPSYTIDTIIHLQEKYPTHEFLIIIGGDSLENLPKWKNYEVLIKNYTFLVYNRPHARLPEKIGSNIILLNAPLLEISSTEIRKNIKESQSVRYLLPEKVRLEVEANSYYK